MPENLTSIGNGSFEQCYNLSLSSLPENVTSIGNDAFYDCDGLVLSSLPENLTYIGERAFFSNEKIALTSLPDGVTSIGDNTFEGCRELALTSLPSKLKTIGKEAFSKCRKITVSSLPEGLQSIGNNAFASSGIAVTNFPSSVTTIGNGAFITCNKLTKLEIPVSVTTIGTRVFTECDNLTTIDIKAHMTEISNFFFDNCVKLETVILPSSVQKIEKFAFGRCDSLKTVTINRKEAPTVISPAFLCPQFTVNVPAEATGYDGVGWNNATIVNYYKISGKVNNWNAEPIEGVSVTLNNSKTVTTDSDGKYQFEMALKNNEAYAIEIEKIGYITGSKKGTVSGQDVLDADFIMKRDPADITVNTSENGEISIDKNTASEGDKVIINITANKGYIIDKITVLDTNDNEVIVTLNDGQYSFAMPEKSVTINSTFKVIEKKADEIIKTGDETLVLLWLMIIFGSMIVTIEMMAMKKRRS